MGCSLFRYSCSKIFVIPLFLLKNFHYSIISPEKKANKWSYIFCLNHPKPIVGNNLPTIISEGLAVLRSTTFSIAVIFSPSFRFA